MSLESQFRFIYDRAKREGDHKHAETIAHWAATRHGIDVTCEAGQSSADTMHGESDAAQ